jgi:hypothetical protein
MGEEVRSLRAPRPNPPRQPDSVRVPPGATRPARPRGHPGPHPPRHRGQANVVGPWARERCRARMGVGHGGERGFREVKALDKEFQAWRETVKGVKLTTTTQGSLAEVGSTSSGAHAAGGTAEDPLCSLTPTPTQLPPTSRTLPPIFRPPDPVHRPAAQHPILPHPALRLLRGRPPPDPPSTSPHSSGPASRPLPAFRTPPCPLTSYPSPPRGPPSILPPARPPPPLPFPHSPHPRPPGIPPHPTTARHSAFQPPTARFPVAHPTPRLSRPVPSVPSTPRRHTLSPPPAPPPPHTVRPIPPAACAPPAPPPTQPTPPPPPPPIPAVPPTDLLCIFIPAAPCVPTPPTLGPPSIPPAARPANPHHMPAALPPAPPRLLPTLAPIAQLLRACRTI